jgi:hypothetical protein
VGPGGGLPLPSEANANRGADMHVPLSWAQPAYPLATGWTSTR